MAEEGSAQNLQIALDQTAGGLAPPPTGWHGAGDSLFSHQQPIPSPHTAARELAHSRRKRREAEGGDRSDPRCCHSRPVDGRPEDRGVDAKEAARDLARYRTETAQKLLETAGAKPWKAPALRLQTNIGRKGSISCTNMRSLRMAAYRSKRA